MCKSPDQNSPKNRYPYGAKLWGRVVVRHSCVGCFREVDPPRRQYSMAILLRGGLWPPRRISSASIAKWGFLSDIS